MEDRLAVKKARCVGEANFTFKAPQFTLDNMKHRDKECTCSRRLRGRQGDVSGAAEVSSCQPRGKSAIVCLQPFWGRVWFHPATPTIVLMPQFKNLTTMPNISPGIDGYTECRLVK